MSDLEGVKLAVTVKPLEWKHLPALNVWTAADGAYWAWERNGVGYWRRWWPAEGKTYTAADEGAAEAACQADYEQRILSALSPSPVPAPLPGSGETKSNYPEIPDGWKLVPVEPTEAMLKAGMDDLGWWVEPYEAPRESGVPVECDMSAEDAARINSMQIEVVASAFSAMLAASPNPAETQAVEVGK